MSAPTTEQVAEWLSTIASTTYDRSLYPTAPNTEE
jgi:hypothetical protein